MTDTLHTINCPACGAKMEKIFISDKGISIDVCSNGCGGIYFDNQEIQEFGTPDADISEITNKLANKRFLYVDEKRTRTCPCGTPMVKTNVFGIEIDSCYKCGGLFLDNGEFEQIRTHFTKKKKVEPVNFENNEINLEEFCKDSYGRSKSYGTLGFFLRIFNPTN